MSTPRKLLSSALLILLVIVSVVLGADFWWLSVAILILALGGIFWPSKPRTPERTTETDPRD